MTESAILAGNFEEDSISCAAPRISLDQDGECWSRDKFRGFGRGRVTDVRTENSAANNITAQMEKCLRERGYRAWKDGRREGGCENRGLGIR